MKAPVHLRAHRRALCGAPLKIAQYSFFYGVVKFYENPSSSSPLRATCKRCLAAKLPKSKKRRARGGK